MLTQLYAERLLKYVYTTRSTNESEKLLLDHGKRVHYANTTVSGTTAQIRLDYTHYKWVGEVAATVRQTRAAFLLLAFNRRHNFSDHWLNTGSSDRISNMYTSQVYSARTLPIKPANANLKSRLTRTSHS
jgi:hypothetical protein